MRKLGFLMSIGLLLVTGLAQAGPEEDRSAIVKYFEQRFPTLEPADFANGAYSLDDDAREQWQEIEEFPPYEFALDRGRALFETPFANGKSYADCFANGGLGISQNYPLFDTETGQVVTWNSPSTSVVRPTEKRPCLGWKGRSLKSLPTWLIRQEASQ